MRSSLVVASVLIGSGLAALANTEEPPPAAPRNSESVTEATCRLIEGAARTHRLPVTFLTRLIWRESSFRPSVVSPAGAQGVAQFMPGTASERGLANPFDPEEAIPQAARFLADLNRQFGNLGLAAAGYNGGPGRVAGWLAGRGQLPQETRDYVVFVTGRAADEWAAEAKAGPATTPDQVTGGGCLQVIAGLRRPGATMVAEAPLAPWGVQLAGNFSKEVALASFARARQSYASVLGDVRPMVIGTRLRTRGIRTYYRVRVPQATRAAALKLCDRIRAVGGACVVLPS